MKHHLQNFLELLPDNLSRSLRGGSLRRQDVVVDLWKQLQLVLAEDPECYVKSVNARFRLDVRSRLFLRILSEGDYEPGIATLLRAHIDASKDAIDVGANVGFFTSLFASHISNDRRVLAFEPTPNALRHLRYNLDTQGFADRVILFEGVASDQPGQVDMSVIEGQEEFSSIGNIVHTAVADQPSTLIKVESICIDEIVSRYGLVPGIIKIDTEGAEFHVLSGARETMRRFRPVIVSELSSDLLHANGSSVEKVMDLLDSLNYRVTDPFSSRKPGRRLHGEVLAVPL